MTAITNALATARLISSIERMSAEQGMTLEISNDFEEFLEVRQSQSDRVPISAVFDPTQSDVTHHNGFWVKGVDSEGRVVHVQAARLVDLEGKTLAEHLDRRRRDYVLPGADIDLERSDFSWSLISHKAMGCVCYHGEHWLEREYRGQGLSSVLPRLALALMFIRWSPDYVFAFAPQKLAYRGIPIQYGYMHLAPGGVMWKMRDTGETLNEWIMWSEPGDLDYLMRFKPGLEC